MKYFHAKFILTAAIALFSTVMSFAQNEFGGVVKFDKTVHDFGDILISSGEVHCTFTFTNISSKPIVVHRVISSCGCTDPEWTKQPVAPGKTGKIDVTFKNDQGPFPFDKAITTYISDLDKPVILRIRGVASEKKKSLKEYFGVHIGDFGMRDNTVSLGQIEQGTSRIEKVEVANLSSSPMKVEFTAVTPGLSLELDVNPIPPKSKANLTYSVNTESTSGKLWGMNTFNASVKTNGRLQSTGIKVETLIKDNFSEYTADRKKAGALPQFVTSSKSFGTCKAGEVQKLSFVCKNIGKEKLIIYKVQSSEPGCTFKYPETIEAGSEGTIDITIDTAGVEGEVLHIVTMIVNAPLRPMVNVFVTGNVEK